MSQYGVQSLVRDSDTMNLNYTYICASTASLLLYNALKRQVIGRVVRWGTPCQSITGPNMETKNQSHSHSLPGAIRTHQLAWLCFWTGEETKAPRINVYMESNKRVPWPIKGLNQGSSCYEVTALTTASSSRQKGFNNLWAWDLDWFGWRVVFTDGLCTLHSLLNNKKLFII